MRAFLVAFAVTLFLFAAAPGLADDLLTIAYTANTSGEYSPCPT